MKITLLPVFLFISLIHSFGQVNTGEIEVSITGFRSQKGNVSLNLFNNSEGFPDHNEKSLTWKTSEIRSGKVVITFRDLPFGSYALSILHDENENGRMEKNFLGIPKEGFAFSNNFKPLIASPSFRETAFRLDSAKLKLNIKLIYF